MSGQHDTPEASLAFDADAAERSPIALALTGGPGHSVRYANPALARLCDRSPVELVGRPITELFRDSDAIAGSLDAAYERGTLGFADAHSPAGDRRLAIIAAPHHDPAHHLRGLLVQVAPADTADARAASDDLRAANQELLVSGLREHEAADRARQDATEFRALLEGINEGVTVFDASGSVILINRVGKDILGLTDQAPSLDDYRRCDFRTPDGDRLDYERDLLAGVLDGESFADREIIRCAEDGREQRLITSGSAVRDADHDEVSLAIHIYRDVTALRELERVREQHIALISHDLRGPLASAKMAIQLLAMSPPSPKQNWLIERAIASMARIERMTEDLLDSQRIRSGRRLSLRLSACDLVAIASEVADELRALHGDRIVINGDKTASGFWDCDQLRRAIWNLLANALKHGNPAAPVHVTVRGDDDSVVSTFHNFGQPIPESARARLFSPFSQTKSGCEQPGWGLGLTLVKGAASAHGGTIEVESNEETGTTFTLVLPRDGRHVLDGPPPPG